MYQIGNDSLKLVFFSSSLRIQCAADTTNSTLSFQVVSLLGKLPIQSIYFYTH